jgi:hypothetical protein
MTTYRLALDIIQYIDYHLALGTRHFYSRSGELLTDLYAVVEALIKEELR